MKKSAGAREKESFSFWALVALRWAVVVVVDGGGLQRCSRGSGTELRFCNAFKSTEQQQVDEPSCI